jgi:hypothetical protein
MFLPTLAAAFAQAAPAEEVLFCIIGGFSYAPIIYYLGFNWPNVGKLCTLAAGVNSGFVTLNVLANSALDGNGGLIDVAVTPLKMRHYLCLHLLHCLFR